MIPGLASSNSGSHKSMVSAAISLRACCGAMSVTAIVCDDATTGLRACYARPMQCPVLLC